VVAHAAVLTEGVLEHADVVFPSEAGAEKEGTVTHPDGRLQRLRPAVGKPEGTLPTWQVLSHLITALGGRATALTSMMITSEIAEAVPFYAGITHDEIGGFGIRWQDRDASQDFPAGDSGPFTLEAPQQASSPNGALRLGSFKSVWSSPEVVHAPALKFLAPKQRAELNPDDAADRGIRHGQRVVVSADGATVSATAHLRTASPRGSVFLETGLGDQSATALASAEPTVPSMVTVESA
jgi:NADH-quinone oxidoreductase subunit G